MPADMAIAQETSGLSGADLYRHVLRLYPTADVDDYFKNGQWKDEAMKTDIALIEMHRKEAGAPDPIPLEEVEMPTMPQAAAKATALTGGVPVLAALKSPLGVVTPGTIVGKPAAGAKAPAPGGSVAELRLIALFVAKWKLDPTRAKILLAKLPPQRRRYIIQNFKTTTDGMPGTLELEEYIKECEQTKVWDAPTAGASATAPAATTATRRVGASGSAPVLGVKRPIASAGLTLDPSKKPRIGSLSIAPSGTPTAAERIAAARARLAATSARAPAPAARPLVAQYRPGGATVRPAAASFGVRPVAASIGGRPTAGGWVRPAIPRPVTPRPGTPRLAMPRPAMARPGGLAGNLVRRF